jgi:hypothetical protein
MIQMHFSTKEDVIYPIVTCDQCRQRITDATMANVLYAPLTTQHRHPTVSRSYASSTRHATTPLSTAIVSRMVGAHFSSGSTCTSFSVSSSTVWG